MTRTEATSAPEGPRRIRPTATLALLAFAMLIVSLDQYIVVVRCPRSGAHWITPRRPCRR
jgi:hypothetical protein